MKKTIRRVIFILALCILAFSCWKIADYYLQEMESHEVVSSAAEQYTGVDTGILAVNFTALREQYPDVVAWLYQPNTNINYPVVQSEDNEYYLRRLLNGKYNVNGTLFVDYRCSGDFSDYVTMIYGHNMKNGEMFATFPNYANQEYFEAHPEMVLSTPNGTYKIKLFAGYLTDDTDEVYSFAEDELGAEYIFNTALAKSAFKSDITTYNGEKLVLLSTCSYEKSNSRFILMGILDILP